MAFDGPKTQAEWRAAYVWKVAYVGMRDALARTAKERDAARVEAEELRAAIRDLVTMEDDPRHNHARDILARAPSVAGPHAREALAALAWARALDAWDWAIAPPMDSYVLYERKIGAANDYRAARDARIAAEKETKP